MLNGFGDGRGRDGRAGGGGPGAGLGGGGGATSARYFVQAYKAKGSRLVGQASDGHGYADEALAAAKRIARWRAGVVVFAQEVDEEGVQRGRPAVLAIHGLVPDGWLAADRRAA